MDRPVLLEPIESYEPVISVAIEPKTHTDQEKFEQVLEKFMAEDPTLRVKHDEDTGQVILSGMGDFGEKTDHDSHRQHGNGTIPFFPAPHDV